jgi:hypothetical protein
MELLAETHEESMKEVPPAKAEKATLVVSRPFDKLAIHVTPDPFAGYDGMVNPEITIYDELMGKWSVTQIDKGRYIVQGVSNENPYTSTCHDRLAVGLTRMDGGVERLTLTNRRCDYDETWFVMDPQVPREWHRMSIPQKLERISFELNGVLARVPPKFLSLSPDSAHLFDSGYAPKVKGEKGTFIVRYDGSLDVTRYPSETMRYECMSKTYALRDLDHATTLLVNLTQEWAEAGAFMYIPKGTYDKISELIMKITSYAAEQYGKC